MIKSASMDSPRRHRRFHSLDFKISAVNRCLQPGVSVASVARQLDLNANLLRQWVTDYEHSLKLASGSDSQTEHQPAFVPVKLQSLPQTTEGIDPSGAQIVSVFLEQGDLHIRLEVHSSQVVELGKLLREVLR